MYVDQMVVIIITINENGAILLAMQEEIDLVWVSRQLGFQNLLLNKKMSTFQKNSWLGILSKVISKNVDGFDG